MSNTLDVAKGLVGCRPLVTAGTRGIGAAITQTVDRLPSHAARPSNAQT